VSKTALFCIRSPIHLVPIMPDNTEPHHSFGHGVAVLPRLLGRALVAIYRYTLSPLIGPRCRHLPSCSEYADEAITRFGLVHGWRWPASCAASPSARMG
jgi:hypothetical protein